MLSEIEQTRLQISKNTEAAKKSQFGQFFTPARTAAFMANLFPASGGMCRLLDAGAGIGSLSASFLDRWRAGNLHFDSVELDVFEIDPALRPTLADTLSRYKRNDLTLTIRSDDFIHAAADALSGGLFSQTLPKYTHIILNPPYKKTNNQSAHRTALRRVGIETVNLYSAFVALALALATPGAHLVAILPRSFCNGPYYRPFREFLLKRAAIRHLHLFESRNKAFKDDAVLQENVIVHLERGGIQGPITISTSADDTFADLETHQHPFERIVFGDDPERFIHIPTKPEYDAKPPPRTIQTSLAELGIDVSTGPVVDFRLKDHLRAMPGACCVPLLYPAHFSSSGITWPIAGIKKPNAIERNADTEKWLYPKGFYCVIRRFSSKEESHRIVASVVDPSVFGNVDALGFENHLNVFHASKHGLPQSLARGLAVYLSTTTVDTAFRRFSGHTQVNATDLRLMKYPSREALIRLGEWATRQGSLTQDMIDAQFDAVVK